MIKSIKQSPLESLMESQMYGAELPSWETEFQFSQRKFRFDFAWPSAKIALEVEGGTWSGGRHTTGKGYEKDCEKYNLAVILGWKVIRATSAHVKNGQAVAWIELLLKLWGKKS